MHKRPNILIVDDNEAYLLYLEYSLRDIDANIITANSGLKALDLTSELVLTLAILDVQMPNMSGFELAQQLNLRQTEQKIPVIFLTASDANQHIISQGYNAGAVDYIFKPIDHHILISKINIFLELFHQKQREIEKSIKLKHSETELKLAKQQLENFNHHLINAIEEEKVNISFLVHDELGQAMTALKIDLNNVKHNRFNPGFIEHKIDQMLTLTNEVIQKVQRISLELHPGILYDLGLVAAIEWYCKDFEDRTGVKCNLDLQAENLNYTAVDLALYRILQEALTNIIRHSGASTVNISLSTQNNEIKLIIADNGCGMPESKLSESNSMGIMSMRQRVHQCKGNIVFYNSIAGGLNIIITIPQLQINYENSYSR